MSHRAPLRGETFVFTDLRELFGRANEEKSGDQLAGVAARSERERVAAKIALADVSLREIVDYEFIDDDVTALIRRDHDTEKFAAIASLTVGEFREFVLDPGFVALWNDGLHRAITPEMAAATAKLMGARDLIAGSARLRVVTRCRNTMGEAGVLGVRIQPNHPTDDPSGVALSVIDGLVMGCGDAVIGINPVNDSVASVAALEHAIGRIIEQIGAPTQSCVLAHFTTQLAALAAGAPIDLLFQSIAGTEGANRSFGVDLTALAEGREAVLAHHHSRGGFIGEQVMYFETGQGSALSAEAHGGLDQLTCEARAHGVARAFDPFLVNSVVGFIGPEYLADARQIMRAGLEDHFMGKLLGLPMGVDVCYTNHVDADADTTDQLLMLLATAGCNFIMGVPGSDDVMLNYQSTSPHDALAARELFGLRPAPEFADWLETVGIHVGGKLATSSEPGPAALGSIDALRGAVAELAP
jgi:ethanolamine ammonia-lyase large subunit